MRKIYGYETDSWRFVEDANHQYVPWLEPCEIVFRNYTQYDLMLVRQEGAMPWMELKRGQSKTVSSDNWLISRFFVKMPNGMFWFQEECGVIIGREVRQGFLQNEVVPIHNNGAIEFLHMPKKWTLEKRSIKKVHNPAYQVKVCNHTPYDVIIWLDDDIIDIVKSKWINTLSLPSGNHMLWFDTKEEECLSHDKFSIWEDFLGPVNGCQMGIIEDFSNVEPSWQKIIDRMRGYAGWYEVEKIDAFKERMFFWQHFIGPGSIEPFIRHLYATYAAKEKNIDIWYNTIDYRVD